MIRTCECILRENPQLAQVLESPVIRQSRKETIIDRVFENPDFSRIMRNFLKKVCEAGCMDQMESMVRIRDEKSREAAGILSAKLRYVTGTGCGRSQGHEGASVQNIRKEQRGAVHRRRLRS
ncbi:MAG: F0F1 ATP synthase subunit delta [Clostridium sp.]